MKRFNLTEYEATLAKKLKKEPRSMNIFRAYFKTRRLKTEISLREVALFMGCTGTCLSTFEGEKNAPHNVPTIEALVAYWTRILCEGETPPDIRGSKKKVTRDGSADSCPGQIMLPVPLDSGLAWKCSACKSVTSARTEDGGELPPVACGGCGLLRAKWCATCEKKRPGSATFCDQCGDSLELPSGVVR